MNESILAAINWMWENNIQRYPNDVNRWYQIYEGENKKPKIRYYTTIELLAKYLENEIP